VHNPVVHGIRNHADEKKISLFSLQQEMHGSSTGFQHGSATVCADSKLDSAVTRR
jgi:hypothetical protein